MTGRIRQAFWLASTLGVLAATPSAATAEDFTDPDLESVAAAAARSWRSARVYLANVSGGPYPRRPGKSSKFRWRVLETGFDGYAALPLDDIDAAVRESVERTLLMAEARLAASEHQADLVLQIHILGLVLETSGAEDVRACRAKLEVVSIRPDSETRPGRTVVEGSARLPGANTSIYSTAKPHIVFHADDPSIFDLAIAAAMTAAAGPRGAE